MKNNLKMFLLSLSVVLCLTALTFGQRTSGDIEGTVKDAQGAVIPGASVTVSGVNVGFKRTVQSDSQGRYQVLQIPAGTYTVTTAAINGFAESTTPDVVVTIEQKTVADIILGTGTSTTEVLVTTDNDPLGVTVDSTESKVQTNITSALIDQLPKGTSFQSVLKVSPGTRPEPLSGGFQVDGASGAENNFVIDGQSLENFRTGTLNAVNNLPTSLIQEIQVKTGGFEAEHGGASGAVVSVQTKGGTDQWRGEFGTQLETSKLQPGNRFAPSSFQASGTSPQNVFSLRSPKSSYTNYYPTASFGGPIIKGRAWFYGNYSPQIFDRRVNTIFYNPLGASSFTSATTNQAGAGVASGVNLVVNPAYPAATYQAKSTYEYAFTRIDASIFNNLRYSGTFLYNPLVNEGTIPYGTISVGGTPINNRVYGANTFTDVDFRRLGGGRANSNNFTSQVVYSPTSKLIVNLRYGHAFLNEKANNYGALSGPYQICSGLAAGYTGVEGCPRGFNSGATPNVLRDASIKNEFNGDVTYSLNNFGGRHEFKGGYQYGTTKNDVAGSTFADPNFGRTVLQYGRNFDIYLGAGYNQFCNLRTTANPTGNCLGVGQLLRFGTNGIASNKYQGIFVQDKWQPTKRLTFNLGVRLEKENLPAFNTGNGRGGIPLEFGFGKKVAPRLGVSYDPFGDGKTRVFASYGQFYDRLKFELPRGSFGGDFYRVDYFPILASNPNYTYYTNNVILGNFKDPIGGGDPRQNGGLSILDIDFRIPSNITAAQATALGLPFAGVDPDLKPFRQDEITVGAERQLSRIFVLQVRYTRKNVASAVEDHGILGANLSENYIISNPGKGKAAQLDRQAGYVKSVEAERLYNGLEISFTKRLSNNYFFNANYTLSRLYGNYSGLASSDEATVNSSTDITGRASPGVSRYFDYIVNGFTFNGTPDNGLLPTDRTHAFKAYGGYNFDWFKSKSNLTEISFFQQILQGTPQTTYIGIQNSSIVYDRRGDLGRTPTFYQTDIALSHKYRFGRDSRYTVEVNMNVLNLFNNNTPILLSAIDNKYSQNNTISFGDIDPNYATTGNPAAAFNAILTGKFKPSQVDAALAAVDNPRNVLYGQPAAYQSARNVRFGFRFFF